MESYSGTRFEELPEGRLGSLRIHRSGRVVFVMGDHRFEVNQGSDCNFSQVRQCGRQTFVLFFVIGLFLGGGVFGRRELRAYVSREM